MKKVSIGIAIVAGILGTLFLMNGNAQPESRTISFTVSISGGDRIEAMCAAIRDERDFAEFSAASVNPPAKPSVPMRRNSRRANP